MIAALQRCYVQQQGCPLNKCMQLLLLHMQNSRVPTGLHNSMQAVLLRAPLGTYCIPQWVHPHPFATSSSKVGTSTPASSA